MSVLCTLPYAFLGVCFCFLVWGSNLKSLTFQARALPAALPFRLCKGTGSWEILVPEPKQKQPSPDPGPHGHPKGSFRVPKPPTTGLLLCGEGHTVRLHPQDHRLKVPLLFNLSISCCSQPCSGPLKGASSEATSGGAGTKQ